MASQNFIDECKIGANSNRMCRFVADNLLITQSNYLQSLEINSSIFNDGSIIGSLTASKAELALLNLPANTYHLTQDEEYDIEKNYYSSKNRFIGFRY